MEERAVSPVVGIALLIAIALILASAIGVGLTQMATLDDEADRADGLVDGSDAASGTDTSTTDDAADSRILVSEANPGEATLTDDNGGNLEFEIENTHDESVTAEAFAIDATAINASIEVDDENTAEVEIADEAVADRDNGSFAANGTRYDFVVDGGNETTEITADADDVKVGVRYFEPEVGALEVADDESDADLTVSLYLDDGSEQAFHFRKQ